MNIACSSVSSITGYLTLFLNFSTSVLSSCLKCGKIAISVKERPFKSFRFISFLSPSEPQPAISIFFPAIMLPAETPTYIEPFRRFEQT